MESHDPMVKRHKVLLFANTDWYLYNFRRSLARTLQSCGFDVVMVSPPGPYAERLGEMGFRWREVGMLRRSLNPIREARLLLDLAQLFREEAPSIVHSFTIKPVVYGALVAKAAGGIPRVNAVAGMGYVFTSDDSLARVLRPLVRVLFKVALGGRRARLILQNGDDVDTFVSQRLVSALNIRLIQGSGVDCVKYAPKNPVPESDSFRVLLASRLVWDKGVGEFVEAARILRAKGLRIEFLLAGEPDPGNPASIAASVARGWVEEGVITWLGHVDAMEELMTSVNAFALPSYREGLPRGLIEAAACGLPLVTTDVPGCRDVVTNEVDGLLVPPKDGKALAAAIERLHADRKLAKDLGDAARRKATSVFDENIVIEQTISVYRELLL